MGRIVASTTTKIRKSHDVVSQLGGVIVMAIIKLHRGIGFNAVPGPITEHLAPGLPRANIDNQNK